MRLLIFVGLAVLCASLVIADNPDEHSKVICYYNSTTYMDPEFGTFGLYHLSRALGYCTHLIYGYSSVHPTKNTPMQLQRYLDLPSGGKSLWDVTKGLKHSHPGLKVYLCVGGNADSFDGTHKNKYFRVVETAKARSIFVERAFDMITRYGFDGIDLAWQFPIDEERENSESFDSTRSKSTKKLDPDVSSKETIRRRGFTALVIGLKNKFKSHNLDVTVTVLPHLHTSGRSMNALGMLKSIIEKSLLFQQAYYEPRLLAENVDAIHLTAFNQRTPARDPKEADYPAPMYKIQRNGRPIRIDVNSTIVYWLTHGTPRHKIVLGIPTFARTWKLTDESGTTGLPPLIADGPGAAGPLTKTPGILSYAEVCSRLAKKSVDRVRRVADPSKRLGTYAFLPYNPKTGTDGIWIGYEDPETAASKAAYARKMGLGGVAIFDLSTDDFHHICTPDEFPIVRATAFALRNSQQT